MPTPPPPATAPPARLRGRLWALTVLAVVLAAHGALAVRLFPTWRSIVDPEAPVVMVDHAIHEYHGALGAGFLREHGTTWGYDPFFMAGYPETPVWDSSSNLAILFETLGGGGYNPQAYKIGLLVTSWLALALVPAGAWALGLGAAEAAVAAALAWLYFWTGTPVMLWRTGLFAFVVASGGVGLLLGLCVRFDGRPTRAVWCALTATGAGLCFAHVTGPILALGGALTFYASVARRHGGRWHTAVVGAAVLTVVANLVWLVPLWRFRGIRTGSGLFMNADSARFLLDYYLGAAPSNRLCLGLFIFGIAGLAAWWFRGRRPSSAAFSGSIAVLFALAGFGSLWGPTRHLEPLRFLVPLHLLLTVPAASALVGGTLGLARLGGGGPRGRLFASAIWGAALGTGYAAQPRVFLVGAHYLTESRPLAIGLAPEMRVLVRWFRENTDPSARILFEDQLRLLERTEAESTHWTPLLPFLLRPDDRMFIGGLYQTAFIRHHARAAFGDFQLGDRFLDEWSHEEVGQYVERYNIGWVVCWSPLSRFWFDRYAPARRVATLPRYSTPGLPPARNPHEWDAISWLAGPATAAQYLGAGARQYAVYRIDRPHSYFLRGRGRVTSFAPNRIELADLEPDERGAVVLSLHWLDTWRTDPPRALGPEPAAPDPVAFVRIELPGPVPRLLLFNSYRRDRRHEERKPGFR